MGVERSWGAILRWPGAMSLASELTGSEETSW